MPDYQTRPQCDKQNDATASNDVPAERSRGGAKITCLIVFILFFVAGVVFLWRAVLTAREAARDCNCKCHLKQIALALYNYHQAYKCFPPTYVADAEGRPMHSWRVLLLPFMDGSNDFYKKYRLDEPWDSPNNLAIAREAGQTYCCPSQPKVDYPITNYVAIVGPGKVFDGTRCRTFEEITDGTSNTLLIVEVADSDIRWTEPRDLRFEEIDFRINGAKRPSIGSHHPDKVNVAMCDSAVISLPNSTAPEVVKALTTIDGGEEVELPEK